MLCCMHARQACALNKHTCAPTLPRAAQVVENRIFSEGLHVLGQPPPPDQAAQYLAGGQRQLGWQVAREPRQLPGCSGDLRGSTAPTCLSPHLSPLPPSLSPAYFGDGLPAEAVQVVAAAPPGEGVEELRARLDRIYRQPAASTSRSTEGGRCGAGWPISTQGKEGP